MAVLEGTAEEIAQETFGTSRASPQLLGWSIWEGMMTPITPVEMQTLAPLDAMTMVATQRQQLHEKILRLRALREESEASMAKDKKTKKESAAAL